MHFLTFLELLTKAVIFHSPASCTVDFSNLSIGCSDIQMSQELAWWPNKGSKEGPRDMQGSPVNTPPMSWDGMGVGQYITIQAELHPIWEYSQQFLVANVEVVKYYSIHVLLYF